MKSYVINLDRHSERWARLQACADAVGLEVERISGVDAISQPAHVLLDGLAPRLRYPLSKAEIACTLSHRAAWTEFLKSDDEFCAILEDDIEFGEAITSFLRNDTWIPRDADMVKLETYLNPTFVKRSPHLIGERRLYVLGSEHYGTAGYIVRRSAAKRLLDISTLIDRTTDDILFDVKAIHFRRLRTYQVDPALCIQHARLYPDSSDEYLASSIIPERRIISMKGFAKLRRELIRPFRQIFSHLVVRLPLRLTGYQKRTIAYRK